MQNLGCRKERLCDVLEFEKKNDSAALLCMLVISQLCIMQQEALLTRCCLAKWMTDTTTSFEVINYYFLFVVGCESSFNQTRVWQEGLFRKQKNSSVVK